MGVLQENGTLVTKMYIPVTAEEKTNKNNDVKARSLLLMALPNEHQLTFSQYPDAKTMFAAFETRFGGNAATKKTQKTLLKQHTSSTNDANTSSPQVSTASPNVNTTSPQVSTASFSDNDVYAFMVENPNGSNLLHQDLEKIHEDDLEAMDLKWQLFLLSMRAKRECRAPRSKEGQFINQDNTKKQGNNEDTSSKAMLAIDGVGFDWSDLAEEQVQTNMALMAFSDSEVYTDKTCSKTCQKNYETLKKQCDDLIVKLNQTKFAAATYKKGLVTVEEQLITYRKNEVLFSEEVAVLKREVACKGHEIKCVNTSKDLDKLLESQITDKSKKGLRYSVVPLPHPLIYNRPKKLDLSYSSLNEFKEPEFKGYGSENSKQESNVVCDKKSDDSKGNLLTFGLKEKYSKEYK
ncbi:hypothetical protein Tco_0681997 [Tanacetum coccineum]|uniref:Uncharacterized protein n=1 Tax=Tanacetum coccineum TaxID=301880 RepID=A0ABQ4XR75_9ASTR